MQWRSKRYQQGRENADEAMAVIGSGNAYASHGGVAVSGIMHADEFTVVQHRLPREPADWPHQVGVVPSGAQAFQDRSEGHELRTALEHGGAVILTGMGGAGKTQLAASYARTAWHDEGIDILIWVTASDRSAIVSSYAQAGVELCRADMDDPERAAETLLAWLATPKGTTPCKWLVVLDDVGDSDDMRGLWPPPNPCGRTVVTTRRRDAALTAAARQTIEVGVFSPAQAAAYLTECLSIHRREEPGEQLAGLVADLGHLPLAGEPGPGR
ncbi:NB-ARC domain-containing protein [Streptomyces sp. Marseille-Q5077]|uniref:NB-ARC domain-containing protein n=1 Tax=Streptomyces sp. Marseille-Q5077 TaxID=3418995 RepID=UPI003D026AA5